MGESVSEIASNNSDEKATSQTEENSVLPAETPDTSADLIEANDDAPKPEVYIEEDDHVEIRGVVERAAKAADEVPLTSVVPNPDQPRTFFKAEEIEELAASIEKDGLLQPIVVRKIGDVYQIIAGERRWRACRSLGMQNVPVRIVDANDDKAIELALIENVQRTDLNPIEEAYGYKRLMERRGMTQSDVASAVSKGRSTIANALRLLELPEDAQQLLYEEKISAGHARAILSIPSAEGRAKLTDKLKKDHLSVRETENLGRLFSGAAKARGESTPREPLPSSFKKVAQNLKEKLKTPVRIKSAGGKHKIEIEFKDEAELKRLFKELAGE
ncbi:MAG: ParB/RepB/Spo0J family partition protein [Eggerthellaceae bacterium]|nr:ParB/RepB/Spo0J family partition protein [Eggerthellaceae bacterium]